MVASCWLFLNNLCLSKFLQFFQFGIWAQPTIFKKSDTEFLISEHTTNPYHLIPSVRNKNLLDVRIFGGGGVVVVG